MSVFITRIHVDDDEFQTLNKKKKESLEARTLTASFQSSANALRISCSSANSP
jgi:hypothetical protein